MRLLIFISACLNLTLAYVSKKRFGTHYCEVLDPEFSYKFDFRKLSKKDDYVFKQDNDELRWQMCDRLRNYCNEEEQYSICLIKDGKQIGIGKEPPEVLPEFGKIIFRYTGDKCNDVQYYTVNIKMICDFAVKDESSMAFAATSMESNKCQYNIAWRTDVACSPKTVVNCTVDHGSDHYDLTKLIKYSDNYKIPLDDKYSVLLNVCHSIVYAPSTCGGDNGICLVKNDAPKRKKSKSLGGLKDNLKFISNGNLSLTYASGSLCTEKVDGVYNIQSVIFFICDLDAIDTEPKYVGGQEVCNYTFVWKTVLACSEKALHEKSLIKENNNICTVLDPVTNYIYNLTSLMNQEYNASLFAITETYQFSICSSLVNSPCEEGTGACRLHNKESGGKANNKLMWKESGVYLNYTDGHLCNRNQSRRYTIIEFSCGDKVDYEIEDENDLCYDVIKISTNLVCNEKKSKCSTAKNEVNLESLIRQNENYVIETNTSNFFINICESLVKKNIPNSCHDAGACMEVISDGKVTDTINIGYPDKNPILTSPHSVTYMYHNGSVCEDDKKSRLETRILFTCDPFLSTLSQGQPRFSSYKKCIYFFDWKTNVVCGKVDGIYSNNYITNTLGDHFNLTALATDKNPVYLIENKQKTKKYKISFSSNKEYCNGALICDNDKNMNYGTKISVQWDYSHNLIHLSSTRGSICDDGSLAQSIITIFCSEESFDDKPLFVKENACSVEFVWYTNKICKSEAEPPLSTLSATNGGVIIGAIIFIIITFLICYLLTNSAMRSRFLDVITNSTTRNCDRVKYSRVNTVEEVHLLLNTSDPTVIDSDSDDDLMEP